MTGVQIKRILDEPIQNKPFFKKDLFSIWLTSENLKCVNVEENKFYPDLNQHRLVVDYENEVLKIIKVEYFSKILEKNKKDLRIPKDCDYDTVILDGPNKRKGDQYIVCYKFSDEIVREFPFKDILCFVFKGEL